ncbi:SEC-C metal-binding domain-containing protein [Desulfobacca acetoxidans]
MDKIGRNAPCPCGSGKKFKKCCLPKKLESQEAPETYHNYCLKVVDSLRQKILRFMKKSGHDKFIKQAFSEYWRTLEPGLDPPKFEEKAYLEFLEWYIHDYLIPGYDQPIITLYLRSNPKLPSEELQILQDWQDAYISVFQVKDIDTGKGVVAEDIFSAEEFFLSDINLSINIDKWDIITFRKIKVLNEWQLSGAGGREHPKSKENIRSFILDHFKNFKKQNPKADIPTFLRAHGYLLTQRRLTLQAKPPTIPQLFTSSGEKLEFWEARYDLGDLSKTMDLLDRAEEFQLTELKEDDRGNPIDIFYDWLELSNSSEKIKEATPPGGLTVKSFFTSGPGMESHRILGSVQLKPGQLLMTAQGKERFALGKQLIENLLNNLIKHRLDSVQSPESMLQEKGERNSQKIADEIPEDIKKALFKEFYDKHYREWLDSPIPALDGKTPRKAIRSKEGKRKVEDLLREMEYLHNENDQAYDISWVRGELKLS